MVINPRLLIVDSRVIDNEENKTYVDLVVLSREASAGFYQRFPRGREADKTELMRYVHENSLTFLGDFYPRCPRGQLRSNFPARRRIEVERDKYHVGDLLTEEEAFGLEWYEPHIDTVAVRIAELAMFGGLSGSKGDEDLTVELRKQGLITDVQTALIGLSHDMRELNVVANERVNEFTWGSTPREQNNASHPITLYLFRPKKHEDSVSVGVGFFVKTNNTHKGGIIYEFMTYVPVPRPKQVETEEDASKVAQ